MFWDCTIIANFWTSAVHLLRKFTRIHLVLDPCFCLLNDDTSHIFSLRNKGMVFAGFIAAKKIIHLWFNVETNTGSFWIRSVSVSVSLEDTIAKLSNSSLAKVEF